MKTLIKRQKIELVSLMTEDKNKESTFTKVIDN